MEEIYYTDVQERNLSMLCHLSALVTYFVPLGGVLGPIILWFLKKEQYAEVDRQGKDSINFQLSILLYALVAGLLIFRGIGILLLALVGIFNLIMVIMASIKSYNGERFEYPFSFRFIR